MRDPWFRIIEVVDLGGRSMGDIANDVAREYGTSVAEMRGSRRHRNVTSARSETWIRLRVERPDLSPSDIAHFFRKCPTTILHAWSKAAHSIDLSERKAYTAAAMGFSTTELVPLVQPGQRLFSMIGASGGRYVALGGGVPVKQDGQLVAGLGISGGTTAQDIELAAFAVYEAA